MKKVSIREFQLAASKYLDFLPIMLTKYNVPVAKVIGVTTDVTTEEVIEDKTPQKARPESVNTLEETLPEKDLAGIKCGLPLCNDPAIILTGGGPRCRKHYLKK
jgi:hypothetical protein